MATVRGAASDPQLELVRRMCATGRTEFAVLGRHRTFSGATGAFEAQFGRPVLGRRLEDVFGDLAPDLHDEIDRRSRHAGRWTLERPFTTPVGNDRRLQISCGRLADPDGWYEMSVRLLAGAVGAVRHDRGGAALTDDIPVGLVEIAHDGRITRGNAALAEIVGAEPVGLWVAELIPPDDLARTFAVVAAAFEDDAPFETEFPLVRPDGRHRWVRATGRCRPGADGGLHTIAGTWTDVTDQQVERERSERFAEILEHVDDLVAVTDGLGSIVYLNAVGREILGVGDAEPVQVPVTELLALVPSERADEVIVEGAAAIAASGSWRGEIEAPTDDGGRTLSVVVTAHTSALDGRRSRIVIARDVTAMRRAERALQERVRLDELTGLANRSALLEELARRTGDGRRRADDAAGVSVLYVDLDHFKPVNDDLGHATGDRVLAEMGRRLRSVVRESDLVARFGGDEFVVVTVRPDDPTGSVVLAERIVATLSEPVAAGEDGPLLTVGASVGVATLRAGEGPDELLARADDALRAAKSAGRARVVSADR